MDWNSTEGRALLWQAYPDGYLAMHGVLTVGGWTCIATRSTMAVFRQLNDPSEVWVSDADSASMSLVRHGDLLPLPDPIDPATWACLLADLTIAPGYSRGVGPILLRGYGFEWRRDWWSGIWTLLILVNPGRKVPPELVGHGRERGARHAGRSFSVDTDDPAEALVRARAQLRREAP